ncbi:flippase [Bacillus sp. FJAT-27445]|uniref:flippase n=1 Tax=Bacillus sp. FJAT-27445 TaxID=1679166 RepID=UPI000743791B|nr:flippase [Bacillus sp. FJAT-27445]
MIKFINNSIWLFFSQTIVKISAFAYGIYLARELSIEDFGRYALAVTVFSILNLIIDCGMSVFTVREVSKRPELAKSLYNQTLKIRLFLAVFIIVLEALTYFIFFRGMEKYWYILLYSMCLIPSAFSLTSASIFNSFQKMGNVARITSLVSIIEVGVGIFLLKKGYGISIVIMISFLSLVIQALYLRIKVTKFFPEDEVKEPKKWYFLLRSSLPLMSLFVINILYFKVDILMISFYKDESAVGLYNAVYKIINALIIIPQVLSNSFFPYITSLINKNPDEYKRAVITCLRIVVLIVLPVSVGILFESQKIVYLLFGEKFAPATNTLVLLGVGMVFLSINTIIGTILLSRNSNSIMIKISIISLILNVLLNASLIPKLAIEGAAIATLTTEILSTFLFLYLLRDLKIKWIFEFKSLLISSVVLGLFLVFVKLQSLIYTIVISAILYVVTLQILGETKSIINFISKKGKTT